MPLDLLPACLFTGPALPEPFVRLELEQALTKAGLLARTAGAEGKELQESWERYERKLRELVVRGGPERVFNHVFQPLVERLGYSRVEDGGNVRTSQGDEEGGRILIADDGARLRVWSWDLEADLDAPSKRSAASRYSPLRVAQRVLLAERERIGLLTNGVELRLVISDPARTDSQVIIPIDTLWRRRRAVPDSYRLLLALASPAGLRKLPELIDQARQQQTRVTNDLRRQAREAIEGFIQAILDHPENRFQVSGVRFQGSATAPDGSPQPMEHGAANLTPDARHLTPELAPDTRHLKPDTLARLLWREGLVVVYRLLVVLKLAASDDPARRFSFADSSIWRLTYAPGTALAPVARAMLDEGAETGRMLEDGLRQLFRLFAEGVESQELTVKPLAGGLFDPAATPTLAGLRWGERAVALLLDRLLWTPRGKGGTARERVSYAALDVEDLGRVYEALLELEPGIAAEPMCRLRRQKLEVVVPLAQGVRYQVSGVREQGSRGRVSGVRGGADEHQQLSRPEGVAEGNGPGGGVLPAGEAAADTRDLRPGRSDPSGGSLSAGEYRGGPRSGEPERVPAPLVDSERLADGAPDTLGDSESARVFDRHGSDDGLDADGGRWQDAERADEESEDKEVGVRGQVSGVSEQSTEHGEDDPEADDSDLTPDTEDLEPDDLTPDTRNRKPTKVEWVEEIHPGRFYLRVGLGRKATGSYYTPRSFVRFLVQETVGPQCDERSPDADPQPARILALRLLDPSMGSGHFLVEACRFLGDRLYDACRRCDELAAEAEEQARKLAETDPAEAARLAAHAEELRRRIEALPDPDNALVAYLPSRAREGDQPGLSEQKARALCRRLAAVHCIYGVDKNPLAVALARVAIWIESHAEGLPLTFLDHRLVVGDSLTGPFAEHLFRFPGSQTPFADDLFTRSLEARLGERLAEALRDVAALEESVGIDVADLERKQAAKARLDGALAPFRLLAAAWAGGVMLGKGNGCDDDEYARFARKVSGVRDQVSGEDDAASQEGESWFMAPSLRRMLARGLGLRDLPEGVDSLDDALALLAAPGAELTPALPYDLAFPEVFYPVGTYGERYGFDVVVGNPPWDAVRPKAKEFFASFDFDILAAPTKREREATERQLKGDPAIALFHQQYEAEFDEQHQAHDRLYHYQVVLVNGEKTGGDPDLAKLFAERNAQLLSAAGLTGVVVPSAFHANEGATGVRRLYFEQMATRCCYSFENRNKLFEIDSRFKFAPIVASRQGPTVEFPCAFYLHDDTWLYQRNGREPLRYSLEFVRRTGGEYLSLMELRSPQDAEVAQVCFANGEPFGQVCERLDIRLGRELHMTDDAWRFTPTSQLLPNGGDPRDPVIATQLREQGYLILHEGKTFHHYTDSWDKPPRYLVHINQISGRGDWLDTVPHYRLTFRDIARSNDERTFIITLTTPSVFGNTAPCERKPSQRSTALALALLAVTTTYVFDSLVRIKAAAHINLFILNPTPVPSSLLTPDTRHLTPNTFLSHSALRLSCNHAGYAALWREQVGDAWREERAPFDWPALAGDDARWAVRAAIDAVVAEAYGLSREQYAHVLSTFSHKSYPQAPELCLAAFDELKALGLEAFTKRHDPYWDIPLNESLPEPVIELPLPEGSGVRGQGSGEPGRRRGRRNGGLAEPAPLYAEPQLALDLGEEPAPAQQIIDFGVAAAARRGAGRRAAESRAGYDAGEAERYERVKALLAERGQLTSGEVQFALGVDANGARGLLKRLVDEGLARVEGEKRGTRYVRV